MEINEYKTLIAESENTEWFISINVTLSGYFAQTDHPKLIKI